MAERGSDSRTIDTLLAFDNVPEQLVIEVRIVEYFL